jgi:hypothetical protein
MARKLSICCHIHSGFEKRALNRGHAGKAGRGTDMTQIPILKAGNGRLPDFTRAGQPRDQDHGVSAAGDLDTKSWVHRPFPLLEAFAMQVYLAFFSLASSAWLRTLAVKEPSPSGR